MQKTFYVQVIEAREVVSRVPTATVYPGVVVKYSGSGLSSKNKKSTGFKSGKTYWAEIFTFPVDNVHSDSVTFQLREKGHHVVSSDWMGEVNLKLSDYDDGDVHLKWFRMGESKLKQHSHKGKGVLLLKIHIAAKNDKPFYKKPAERQLSYDEWIEWSEGQYANSHRGRGAEEEYPVVDNRTRSTSMRGLKEGQERREEFARHRSKSTSEAVREPVDEKQKRLAKSTEEPEVVAAKPRFPISPIVATPPTAVKKNDMLIDLSTPDVKKASPVMARKANVTNPFSADVMSLSEGMAAASLHNKNTERVLTGNPFLDPTPEISRVPRPYAAQ